jgi:hypothetical protein
MKPALIALVLLSFLSTFGTMGCVSGLRSTKSTPPPGAVADAKGAPAASPKGQDVRKKELERLLAVPPPPDKLTASNKGLLIKPSDLSGQDEVRRAALNFTQGLKNVKHVRVCYSKAYGGWFLLTYVPGGKKTVQQEYSWNKNTKEWELSGSQRAFPTKDLDSYLKTELPDEKCILLK